MIASVRRQCDKASTSYQINNTNVSSHSAITNYNVCNISGLISNNSHQYSRSSYYGNNGNNENRCEDPIWPREEKQQKNQTPSVQCAINLDTGIITMKKKIFT